MPGENQRLVADAPEWRPEMLICITNRLLCRDNFPARIDKIASRHPYAVILREKDLPRAEYEALARECMEICEKYGTPLNLNAGENTIEIARNIGCKGIHLSFEGLMKHKSELEGFERVGVSLHSIEEALRLRSTPATYVQAGHIFATDCKAGIPPRGLDFLRQVCESTSLPVFGVGGITKGRYEAVLKTGAAGACVMSQLMTCADVGAVMDDFGFL